MNTQLMRTVRAILALLLFAGAVSVTNAQALPSRKEAVLLLQDRLSTMTQALPIKAGVTTNADRVNMLRYRFYNGVMLKIRKGTAVSTAIDQVYTAVAGRAETAADTLRSEIIQYLTTKS
jgi:hypothetical protein